MTGQPEPSRRELVENIERRLAALEDSEVLEKRFSHYGVPKRMLEKRFSHYGVPATPAPAVAVLAEGNNLKVGVARPDVTAAEPPSAEDSLGLNIE